MSTDPVADRAVLALSMRQAVQAIERWAQRTVHRSTGTALSPNETHLLTRLADAPAQRLGALAQWQGVDRSTMSLQISSLAARELVHRVPDPTDRRATLIGLSEAGRTALDEFVARASRLLEETTAAWSDEDLAAFDGYLARFAADLSATLGDDAPSA